MNRTALCLAMIGLAFVAGPAARAQQSNRPVERRVSEPAGQPDLARVVPSIEIIHGKLGQAFDALRDATGANIFVNWKSLEDFHIDRLDEVTFSARNVPLGDALRALLQIGSMGREELAFSIDHNTIVVNTAERTRWATLETRVYDIRDLLARPSGLQRQEQVARIMDLLKDDIDPISWTATNGDIHGQIREMQGQLIITQTAANQRAVARLIEHLRPVFGQNLESAPKLTPTTRPTR